MLNLEKVPDCEGLKGKFMRRLLWIWILLLLLRAPARALFITPITIHKLNNIGDVNAPSPGGWNVLMYNSTAGKWEPNSISESDPCFAAWGESDPCFAAWGESDPCFAAWGESDPCFAASDAYDITDSNISDWQEAYNRGDHSTQGYFDTDVNTLDDIPDGSTYKHMTAADVTELHGWLDDVTCGASGALTGLAGLSVTSGSVVFEVAATMDTVIVTDLQVEEVDTDLIPDDAWDLGSSGFPWQDLYISRTAYIDDIDLDGSITMDAGETVDERDISADGAVLDALVTESTSVTTPLALSTYDISIPVATTDANGY